ncbi:Tetratricopeptide repeat protein 23-like protein [Pteropus alecto]|uniref:Tetratricopeptide repeat protein 23-like protein n=1 Tax=Pteropus alecto TaxID=9402 RepID=L5K876_PTEAL|nr:Tetratricopeptide repeat protein 23-like protein [Pteropus alecto]
MLIILNRGKIEQVSKPFLPKLTSHVIVGRKKTPASPIRIPTVSSDIDWDYCFLESQQTKIPAQQPTEESYPTSGSEESEDDTKPKEKATDCMSLPWEKLAQSQEKIAQLIKEKMNTQANKELIRCVILSQITFGEEHWKCAQALASLAYGYLTLRGDLSFAYQWLSLGRVCVPGIFLDWFTGREAYLNLQKAERNMEELKELHKGGVCGLQVSEKDLTIALGRASLAIQRLNLALAYFEKAINSIIAAKGAGTSDLVPLYTEVAQIEQLRRNHHQAIQYLQQAHSICVSLFTEVSPQTAEASALLAKAYAMSGEAQHIDVAEMYFIKSISAYQTTLGPENCETLMTIGEFYKWLIHKGEKECLMIQILLYGSEHSKSRDTKNILTLVQRSLVISKEKTSIQVSHNKANLADNESFGPQNIFIDTDSRGRSKAELKTRGKKGPLSSSITAVLINGSPGLSLLILALSGGGTAVLTQNILN